MANTTHNGKDGGLLKGKRHYAKDGAPLGGIKAIVADTGQQVELEGGEVIINREASKKHWKELSRINQSAGGGVPILPPDTVEADTEQYKRGGKVIDFNPNVLPTKHVYDFAKKIKDNYPKVWEEYANVYGNEAFENLGSALKRGYWLDSEEWFYYKWKAFNPKHKGNATLKGVMASLKWCTINSKGWDYMKSVIAEEIKKQYPKAKMKLGGKTPLITPESKKHLAPTFITDNENIVADVYAQNTSTTEINALLNSVGLPLKVTNNIGTGAYGTAFLTDKGTVLKVTELANEAYASYVISKSNFKSQAKVYNVFKITDGKQSLFFIEKERVKVAQKSVYEEGFPFRIVFGEAYTTGSTRVKASFTNKDIIVRAKDFYEEWLEELADMAKKTLYDKDKQKYLDGIKEYKAHKKYVIEKIYNLFVFYRDLEKETETKKGIKFNDMHSGNFGEVGNKFVCFDCVSATLKSEEKSFMVGGELDKGIEVEKEHNETLKKLFQHKITPEQAPRYIAKDHLEEDENYYTKLEDVEGKQFAKGRKVPEGEFNIGDIVTWTPKGETSPVTGEIKGLSIFRGMPVAHIAANGRMYNPARYKLTKVSSTEEPKALFTKGQYVILEHQKDKGPYRLYKVANVYLRERATLGTQYDLELVGGSGAIHYSAVSEGELLDAVLVENLPYKIGDTIASLNGTDDYLVNDVNPITTFLESSTDPSYILDTKYVIQSLAKGKWFVQYTSLIEKPVVEEKPINISYSIKTPTGEPSKLTYLQQMLVRTDAFKKYFGDWEKSAKEYFSENSNFEKNYEGVSKIIDRTTFEPRLMFHGTRTAKEFFVFDANRTDVGRPYAYFAQNIEYAQNFTTSSQRNSGNLEVLYRCFLNVKKPFMAVGNKYELVIKDASYWIAAITLTILFDKYGENHTEEQLIKISNVVDSQIGKYITKMCKKSDAPFWRFMANDSKSDFKMFLMSHGYDGIEYGEELSIGHCNVDDPSQYTMAVTLFDSDQIKLGDGRNLDFDKLNQDIRMEDGGNINKETAIQEPVLSKKDQLGKTLFGTNYKAEDGGLLKQPYEAPQINEDRAYIESLIDKMKN